MRATADHTDWNARYAASELVWGAEPNRFVAEALEGVAPQGRALDLGCGEGRNAIWLATRGWQVVAIDYSEVALERARHLAAAAKVEVEWVLGDVTTFEPDSASFALVLIAYLQLPSPEWRRVVAHGAAALAPGGELLAVGHAVRNLSQGVGGPRYAEVLWDPRKIRADLEQLGLSVERCEEVLRPVETPDGVKHAIDTFARARRLPPTSAPRAT